MDYEQFFPKQTMQEKCDCSDHIRGTVVILLLLSLVFDCITSCRRSKKMERLENENTTLKNVILTSVDKALVRMMKNGNNTEDDTD